MKVVPTNRQFNGQTVKVINPANGLPISDPVELNSLDFNTKQHFLRAIAQGDLEISPESPNDFEGDE